MMEDSFINIHSHHKPKLVNEWVIRNAYISTPNDVLIQLPYFTSVGLHPWFLHSMSIQECCDQLATYTGNDKVLAIGEIGLDKSIETPLSKQIQYFEAQLAIARALQKPVIIHAVRTYQEFLPYLKKTHIPFIFHQFGGNKQQAAELLKYPSYLSFGKNLFEPKGAETFQQTALSRCFLETDTASHLHIGDVYQRAAEIKGLHIDEVKSSMFHNFATVFQK